MVIQCFAKSGAGERKLRCRIELQFSNLYFFCVGGPGEADHVLREPGDVPEPRADLDGGPRYLAKGSYFTISSRAPILALAAR